MFKAFTQPLLHIINPKTGEILNKQEQTTTLELLKKDITLITELAEWQLRTDPNLRKDLEHFLNTDTTSKKHYNQAIANALKIKLPATAYYKHNSTIKRKSGNSRLEHIYQHKIITELKSWLERTKTTKGSNNKYVSAGWTRTANDTIPTNITPKISTSAGREHYAKRRIIEDKIELSLVINGDWYVLLFNLPARHTKAKKITLPDILVTKRGDLQFNFTAEYDTLPQAFSENYIIGIDVGINNYMALSVVDVNTRETVYSCGLSRSGNSLVNSINATRAQVKFLQEKLSKTRLSLQEMNRFDKEIREQRASLSRKRKQLAIQTAQEIHEVAQVFENAPIILEDLSHIVDTMRFGRWNRGELRYWLNVFAQHNETKFYTVNPCYTSQECSRCGGGVSHPEYGVSCCLKCGVVEHRDVMASARIATKFLDKVSKQGESTYRKVLSLQSGKRDRRNRENIEPVFRGGARNTGHSMADRSKNRPTPKRVIARYKKQKELNRDSAVMGNSLHSVITDGLKIVAQDSNKATNELLLNNYSISYRV